MNNLVVSSKNGAQVRLSDIATVFDAQKDVEKVARFNQFPTILMQIEKTIGCQCSSCIRKSTENNRNCRKSICSTRNKGKGS